MAGPCLGSPPVSNPVVNLLVDLELRTLRNIH